MLMFEINLLKNRAISAPMRKAMFWGVSLYLVLCIAALAWLANRGTHRLIRAARLQDEISKQEAQFQRTHHRSQDILEFARRARSRLEMDAQSLETIDELIRNRVSLVNIISALTAPLPLGVDLLDLKLNSKDEHITFSVVIPEGRAEQQISGGRLTSVWNADETLQFRLERIRAVSTKRDRLQGDAVVVMQFSADLK
ncbi:MAG: hypothetical protein HN919_22320 [Verrucomicrobia bacterium]|jgi:hypothetical protein|nr:hypothetical protein [Verrucomicrobiota bacterium]MBT7069048.1 hypothetical protein [Verrucomicrobiota bacterium]MBT7702217.1 hypothetical protein [Verrucomicrobiota bacterium]